MNTCRIIRLVENVGIEPLFLFPKQECKTITLRSPFGGWVIYPLTSHSSPVAPSSRFFALRHHSSGLASWHHVLYHSLSAMSIPFSKFFEIFFTHTTYQKMWTNLISKFYLSNYTRFNISLQIAIKILISYLDSRAALSRAAASARCSGVRSRLIGGLGGLNHDAGQCTISPSSSL